MKQRFRSILTLGSFFVFLLAPCLAQTGLDNVVTLSNDRSLVYDPPRRIYDLVWIGRSTIDSGPLVVKETVPAQSKLIIEVHVSSEETQPITWNGYHLTPTTRIIIPVSGLIEVRPNPIVVQPCR